MEVIASETIASPGLVSWVTVTWLLVASASLTLSVEHLVIGVRRRHTANLAFVATGLSVVAIAGFELALMRAATPAGYGELVRWMHLPIFVLVVSLVLFVRTFFRAGRFGLAVAVVVTRTAALIVNFLHAPNLNFAEITRLRRVPFLGDTVSVAEGIPSRWSRLGELSSVLLLIFLLDAVATVWRRGERRRAVTVGGSVTFFVLLAAGHTALVHAGILSWPYVISLSFLGIVAAMAYELVLDVMRGDHLEAELRLQETARHAAEAENRLRDLELAHLSRVTLLGELSGAVAHELNQPLTAILSNAQAAARMMEQGTDTRGEVREILAEIIAEDKRAAEVIRNMRGLLRKGAVRAEPLDVEDVADEAVRLLHGDLISLGVAVSRDFASGLPRARGDRAQIVQVLMNLLTNACDAMAGTESGERRLHLGGRSENGSVLLSVSDSGCGLANDSDRLFEPFVTTKENGLGLGLAVCRTIVQAHGGRIWATPNAQRGSTFHLALPVSGNGAP
jgi:signal transduction histidine kinase